ncbi:methyltransferase domain-containing protein [Vicingaceae bacterium]|nr:methyltransferase domain-containing protein [Vicingaceae bacterium]
MHFVFGFTETFPDQFDFFQLVKNHNVMNCRVYCEKRVDYTEWLLERTRLRQFLPINKEIDLFDSDAARLPETDVETSVAHRYSAASRYAEPSLCCSVVYDQEFLNVLPKELIERDYGCGNPAKWVRSGEVVLDLGSGGGKICYIASQVVGESGKVIGIDMNDDMLNLARQYQSEIMTKIGYDNVLFFKGKIQDLALDLEKFEKYLEENPIRSANDWLEAARVADQMRSRLPMIEADSVDVVVSNCVLNLVKQSDRRQLFSELYRVLCEGGRAIVSDIVANQPVPDELQNDPELWSGCISGAFVEHEFLNAFEEAGFFGIEIVERHDEPWQTIGGIDFRSVTVRAFKPPTKSQVSNSSNAVSYRGPWKKVCDEQGNEFVRGEPVTIDDHVARTIAVGPCANQFSGDNGNIRVRKTGQHQGQSSLNAIDSQDSNCCDGNSCC